MPKRLALYTVLLSIFFTAGLVASEESTFSQESDVAWETNAFPIQRWKTLIGSGVEGRLNPDDIFFGTWELAPKATYHGHKHQAPEIYYVLSGKALWTVGEETREVTAGTAIYTKPGAMHKMTNLSDEPVRAIWIWWAPDGDRKVFESEYLFTEEPPLQPKDAGFDE